MSKDHLDRRRSRRVTLEAPIVIRHTKSEDSVPSTTEELTKDVSLAGAYFKTRQGERYQANEIVTTSVSIPEESTNTFPFTRLAGQSRIVRVEELPAQGSDKSNLIGVALEFGEDLTALTAIPSR